MTGDVNNSAILFNVDGFSHHTVIASNEMVSFKSTKARVFASSLWCSKLSQSCLINSHKVVHLILDGCNLNQLGPEFKAITNRIDMDSGDVNMFEMFGKPEDELSIFSAQIQKLVLIAEQLYPTTDSDRGIIRGVLTDILTRFYIDMRMWKDDAGNHRDALRIVGIPHEDVPKLSTFVLYLSQAYDEACRSEAKDPDHIRALNILKSTFKNMLNNHSDLFNTTTTSRIDNIGSGYRTIYDFSKVLRKGDHIGMAQLVNILGFAIGGLGYGDLVIIHGAEHVSDSVKSYLKSQFDWLQERGGRVCYSYNSIEKALADVGFSSFDKADYTIFGCMTQNIVNTYQTALGQEIPFDLSKQIMTKNSSVYYIRREFDNVVFTQHLNLGLGLKGGKQ